MCEQPLQWHNVFADPTCCVSNRLSELHALMCMQAQQDHYASVLIGPGTYLQRSQEPWGLPLLCSGAALGLVQHQR